MVSGHVADGLSERLKKSGKFMGILGGWMRVLEGDKLGIGDQREGD